MFYVLFYTISYTEPQLLDRGSPVFLPVSSLEEALHQGKHPPNLNVHEQSSRPLSYLPQIFAWVSILPNPAETNIAKFYNLAQSKPYFDVSETHGEYIMFYTSTEQSDLS